MTLDCSMRTHYRTIQGTALEHTIGERLWDKFLSPELIDPPEWCGEGNDGSRI
jgi:hypothetical protein